MTDRRHSPESAAAIVHRRLIEPTASPFIAGFCQLDGDSVVVTWHTGQRFRFTATEVVE